MVESGQRVEEPQEGSLRGAEALAQAEQLNPRNSKALRDETHELVTYLRCNRQRMDYPACEA